MIKSTPSYPQRPEHQLKRNTIHLSFPKLDTFKMGEIVPLFCKEILPNDYIERLSTDMFTRFPPLYLPIMNEVNFQISYFYVPWRILWPGRYQDSWEFFIRNDSSVAPPYLNWDVYDTLDAWEATTVGEHFGIPSCQISQESAVQYIPINAGPFSALLMIWDEYFRNDQLQGARWFELQGGDNSTGLRAAFPQYDPPVGATQKFLCLKRNWTRDLFTSCTPTPQIGSNTLVPIMRNNSVDDGNWTYLGPALWKDYGGSNPGAGTLSTASDGHTLSGANPVYLDIQETSASIRDLRYALMVTEFLEKDMRLGDRYRDYIKGRWDVDPFPLLVDRPAYIGGSSGNVIVSEVMSHAETLDSDNAAQSLVGSYTGQMITRGKVYGNSFHCKEHGFLIGLVTVWPKTYYFQGFEKMWFRTNNRFDYPFDEFNFIGDEEVKNREIMYRFQDPFDGDPNESIFGYNRRYYDWVWSNAIISGKYRDSTGPLFSFHAGRFFDDTDEAPDLNSEFLECNPPTNRLFVVANEREEEVYAYFWNEIVIQRQIAKYATPGI